VLKQFIVAANEATGTLVLFERDQAAGTLTLLQKDVNAPEAVCVKLLN
jgi:6-phosphogluconolactonase